MVSMPSPPETLKRTKLPSGPWQHISADPMTPLLPSGDHLFVVLDYYSRYMEVQVLKSTTTDKIIWSLKSMFLTHGLPVSITTNNGPQFKSQEFQRFVEDECIDHRKVTPLYSGLSQWCSRRQNRSKIAQIGKKEWRKEIESFLVMHRTTPHSTTGVSPAELKFRRTLRTRFPGIEEFQEDDQEVPDRGKEANGRGKQYADDKRGARESDVNEGDRVLPKQEQTNKLTPTFRPEPFCVMEKTGNGVVVESPEGPKLHQSSLKTLLCIRLLTETLVFSTWTDFWLLLFSLYAKNIEVVGQLPISYISCLELIKRSLKKKETKP